VPLNFRELREWPPEIADRAGSTREAAANHTNSADFYRSLAKASTWEGDGGDNVKTPETAPKSVDGNSKDTEDQIAGRDGGIAHRRDALEDAFNHPVRDSERLVDNQGRVSYRYTGENATAVVNEQGKSSPVGANDKGPLVGASRLSHQSPLRGSSMRNAPSIATFQRSDAAGRSECTGSALAERLALTRLGPG
jgi:hypothetical protein